MSTWIYTTSKTCLVIHVEILLPRYSQDPIAQNFNTRTKIFDETSLTKNMDTLYDYDGIKRGKVALVLPSQILNVLKNNLVGMDEDVDYHISQYGDVSYSSFALYSVKNMNKYQVYKLNYV